MTFGLFFFHNVVLVGRFRDREFKIDIDRIFSFEIHHPLAVGAAISFSSHGPASTSASQEEVCDVVTLPSGIRVVFGWLGGSREGIVA